MDVHNLPAVNASLNAISTVFLVYGYRLIRAGHREQHRRAMLAAFTTSILFLICYVVYHQQVGSVPFQKQGWVRPVYYAVLFTHVPLAATVPFLAGFTLWRAFQGNFAKHRKIARWTFPIWLYVSVTGVIVYLMLYQM